MLAKAANPGSHYRRPTNSSCRPEEPFLVRISCCPLSSILPLVRCPLLNPNPTSPQRHISPTRCRRSRLCRCRIAPPLRTSAVVRVRRRGNHGLAPCRYCRHRWLVGSRIVRISSCLASFLTLLCSVLFCYRVRLLLDLYYPVTFLSKPVGELSSLIILIVLHLSECSTHIP